MNTYLVVQFECYYCDNEIVILKQESLQSNLVEFFQQIGFGFYANCRGFVTNDLYHAFAISDKCVQQWLKNVSIPESD